MKALPIGETERLRRLAAQYGGTRWIPIHEFLRSLADRSLVWCRCNHPGCLNYSPGRHAYREQFTNEPSAWSLASLPVTRKDQPWVRFTTDKPPYGTEQSV